MRLCTSRGLYLCFWETTDIIHMATKGPCHIRVNMSSSKQTANAGMFSSKDWILLVTICYSLISCCHFFSLLHWFSKLETAGWRTAEEALGPQFLKHQQTSDILNRKAHRERGGESVTEDLPIPRNACQESMRDGQITVQQPLQCKQLQAAHGANHHDGGKILKLQGHKTQIFASLLVY